MNSREQAKARLDVISPERRRAMWVQSIYGVLWTLLGLTFVVAGIWTVVSTKAIGMMVVLLMSLGLAAFGVGSHMISTKHTTTSVLWAIGAAKDALNVVRKK